MKDLIKLNVDKLNREAVVVGTGFDIAGSMILGFGCGIGVALYMSMHGAEPYQIEAMLKGPGMRSLFLVLGACFTMAGGALAAWVARRDAAIHGLAVGCLSLALAMVLAIFVPPQPWTWRLANWALAVPAGLLGGWAYGWWVSRHP